MFVNFNAASGACSEGAEHTGHAMTPRLEAATQRLFAALSRVENALTSRLPGDTDRVRELTEELVASRAENQDLAVANSTVAARLDSAIDRLRAVLRG
jgi:cytochrome c-type biogenesis protein CcmH/NrfF